MDGGTSKTNNMQYIKQILTVFSVGLILFTMYSQNQKITNLKTAVVNQEKVVDSLQTKLFEIQTINGRYELSLNYLQEVNPKAATQFQSYLSSETE